MDEVKALKSIIKNLFGVPEAKINISDEDSINTLTETLKAKYQQNFEEGLKDGEKKAKVKVLSSLKSSLGIDLKDTELESLGETLLPKVKDKFETTQSSSNAKDSAEYKELKKTYDAMVTQKDQEIEKAKGDAMQEVESIRKDAILKELLFNPAEGFLIPSENEAELEDRIETAKAFIARKSYLHEKGDDGKYYRVDKDGLRVRDGNKPVTYEDDLRKALNLSFGKGVAGEKQGMGIDKQAGKGDQADTGKPTSFDWSKAVESKSDFKAPTTKEEATKILYDPLASIEVRQAVSDYMDTGALEAK